MSGEDTTSCNTLGKLAGNPFTVPFATSPKLDVVAKYVGEPREVTLLLGCNGPVKSLNCVGKFVILKLGMNRENDLDVLDDLVVESLLVPDVTAENECVPDAKNGEVSDQVITLELTDPPVGEDDDTLLNVPLEAKTLNTTLPDIASNTDEVPWLSELVAEYNVTPAVVPLM